MRKIHRKKFRLIKKFPSLLINDHHRDKRREWTSRNKMNWLRFLSDQPTNEFQVNLVFMRNYQSDDSHDHRDFKLRFKLKESDRIKFEISMQSPQNLQ